MKTQVFIGLSTTFHDPAVAIAGLDSASRYAEVAERLLPYRRARNGEPDPAAHVARLLDRYVKPPCPRSRRSAGRTGSRTARVRAQRHGHAYPAKRRGCHADARYHRAECGGD